LEVWILTAVRPTVVVTFCNFFFFFSSRRRHTRSLRDWSSDVCSSDLASPPAARTPAPSGPGSGTGGGRSPCGGRGCRSPRRAPEIGRASCRERGEVSGVAICSYEEDRERGSRAGLCRRTSFKHRGTCA